MISILVFLGIFAIIIFSKRLLATDVKLPERLVFILLFAGIAIAEVFVCSLVEGLAWMLVGLEDSFSVTTALLNVSIVALVEEGLKYGVPALFSGRLFSAKTQATNAPENLSAENVPDGETRSFLSYTKEPKNFLGIVVSLAIFFAFFETIAYAFEFDSFSTELFVRRIFTAFVLHIGLSLFYANIIEGKGKFFWLCVILHALYNLSTYNLILFFTLGLGILVFCLIKVLAFFLKAVAQE